MHAVDLGFEARKARVDDCLLLVGDEYVVEAVHNGSDRLLECVCTLGVDVYAVDVVWTINGAKKSN